MKKPDKSLNYAADDIEGFADVGKKAINSKNKQMKTPETKPIYVFGKNINKSKNTGIVDVANKKLICICDESVSVMLIKAITEYEQSKASPSRSESNLEWKDKTAHDFLSESGFGSGTNFTCKLVADLMVHYTFHKTSSLESENERLRKEIETLEKHNAELSKALKF